MSTTSSVGGGGRRTRSSVLAAQIEEEISTRGWPEGDLLGSEEQLMERYGVSRTVLRESVRLLRSRGVARARPGPGGGLRVTVPDEQTVRDAARRYLDAAQVGAGELYAVWEPLAVAAATELAGAMEPARAEHLRAVMAAEAAVGTGLLRGEGPNLHVELARLSGNRAMELFVGVIADLAVANREVPEDPERVARWLHGRHVRIVEALIAGDGERAAALIRALLAKLADMGSVRSRPRRG